MKRYLSSISCFLIMAYGLALIGCGPSKNQLAAEQSFYASKVMISKQAGSSPIFEMTAADTTKPIILQNVSALRVFQIAQSGGSDTLPQYAHRDYSAPWVNLLGTTLGVALPWLGAWGMVSAISNVIPKTGNNNTSTNIVTTGDGNKTQVAGNMSITASAGAGNVGISNPTLIQDNTSTPTVVTQPTPVIVTQPPPVIVEQPPPVIVQQLPPIIVPPSYPPPTTTKP